MIPLHPCYNIHFIDREYRLIQSTQQEMLNFNRDEIMGFPLIEFLPPCEAVPAMRAIDMAFESGQPVCFSYSFRDLAFICLLERLDESVVAVHEVFDIPAERPRLKKLLWAACGNFYRSLYNKETG